MRPVLPLLVLAVGAVLAVCGFVWVWTGLDVVQVERGWSAVIAGATMLSAGLVLGALAALIWQIGEIAARLEPRQASVPTAAVPPAPAPVALSVKAVDDVPDDARRVVGRHVSGDTTYVMFADGSVEAQTPEGVVTFSSLDDLRAHAEEREAMQARA